MTTTSDAELIRMARDHRAAWNRVSARVDPTDQELDQACDVFQDIEVAALEIPARTPKGVPAKLRMFEFDIRDQLRGSGAAEGYFDSPVADLEAIVVRGGEV